MTRRFNTLASILALAAVYFGAGKFGLSLAFVNTSASAVWPPTGIALAVLLLWGYRLWPGIFLGAFLVNIATQGSLATALGIATGNTLEALLAAWFVNCFANGRSAFERARDIFLYLLLAAFLSTAVSATLGVTSLALGGFAQWNNYFPVWLTWWLGDAASAIIITPLIVVWSAPLPRWKREQGVEAALMLAAVVLAGMIVFGSVLAPPFDKYPWAFISTPPLLWAAIRCGQRGAVAAAFVLSSIAFVGTVHEHGPFAPLEPNESLLLLQAFIGTITVANLALGAVVSERQRADAELRKSVDKERTRLLGNLAVTQILAESPALNDATPRILQTVGETLGWEVGDMWIPDADGRTLRCLNIWHDPWVKIDKFLSASLERRFAPGVGLPGRVWKGLKPVWIPDVTKDDNFPRAPVAVAEGLHAAFAFPILSGGKFFGVMEFFSHEMREPDEALLAMFGSIGSQIGQFMERKRVEESQKRLAAIVDFSNDAIIGKALAGIVTSWNKGAERIFGYTAAEIVGQPIALLLPPDREKEEELILKRIERGEHIEQYETFRVRKDGKLIGVSLTISPICDEAGRIVGASKIARDITDIVKARATLAERQAELERLIQERTAQLQETVSELEAFSYSISHDLRAPLRAMQSFSSILLTDCAGKLDAQETDYLQRVATAAKRLDQLINDILTYSRTARGELKLEPVALDKLTRDIIEQYPGFQRPHAEITIVGSLPAVLAHEASLTQCISNLLGNGIKFVAEGTVPRIKVQAQPHNSYVRVWFEDNGIGIASRDKERIFGIFQRVHSAEKYPGTGIGLSIVKKAMDRMGGKVGVESSPGQGSRFWIQLPLAS